MKINPRVTVLMSVYNGEKYLRESIDSILQQTYSQFEFLIIDDKSTDKSVEIIESYNDDRIRLVKNESNIKLAASLNKGIILARGYYIARMDDDDISLPTRLAKQVEFMDKNVDIDISGTLVKTIGLLDNFIFQYPTAPNDVKVALLFRSALAHPSVIIRKHKLLQNNLEYDEDFTCAQDYDMWNRCSLILKLANISDVLLKYRCNPQDGERAYKTKQKQYAIQIVKENLAKLGVDGSAISKYYYLDDTLDKKEFSNLVDDFFKIIFNNEELKIYPQKELCAFIHKEIYDLCNKSTHLGNIVLKKYFGFFKNDKEKLLNMQLFKFIIKCLIKYKS